MINTIQDPENSDFSGIRFQSVSSFPLLPSDFCNFSNQSSWAWGGGLLPLTAEQYAYARMVRVPFWPISVPQRIGFSSNVPLTKGRVLNTKCVPERV